jgi:hypothetical protein
VSGAGCRGLMRIMLSIALAMSLAVIGDAFAADTVLAHRVAYELSREQAAQMLQQRYGSAARAVRLDVVEQRGRRVYVFRFLSVNGRVWIVHIDAKSGTEVPGGG